MSHHNPVPPRPKATPKKPTPNVLSQNSTADTGPNSPSQSRDTGRRQTRQATALANQQPRKAVDFVSGGIMENAHGLSKHPEELPATQKSQTRGKQPSHATSKGKKNTGVSGQDKNANALVSSTLASATKETRQPVPDHTLHSPTKPVQHAETQEHLDTNILDHAPYSFEGSEPPISDPPLASPHPEPALVSPNLVQPDPQSLPPMALSQAFPGLPPPDPNNLYDQLRFYQAATERLIQSLAVQRNPEQPTQERPSPKPQPSTSRLASKRTNNTKKTTKPATPIRGHHQPVHPSVQLSMIPPPKRGDKTPLDVAMGLAGPGRYKTYIQIRGRIRKILLNVGLDWSKPWPGVPSDQKAMLFQIVRAEIPYMERFEDDWATIKIASKYSAHLRSSARKNDELPADPRYSYLAANSAKRSKDAPRGTRPGLARGQGHADTNNGEGQGPGPSRVAPTFPNINTTADEDMMNAPGLFGLRDMSDDEDDSSVNSDSEGRK